MSTTPPGQPVTAILAVMLGWIWQKYSKPSVTTRLNCLPGSSTPESTPPERAVTVCGAVSSLSKTTLAPLATVRVPGAKLSPAILTVPPPAPPPACGPGPRPRGGGGRGRRGVGQPVAEDDHRAGHGQPDHHDDDQQPDRVRARSIGGPRHLLRCLSEPRHGP